MLDKGRKPCVTTAQSEAIDVALAPENNADNLRDFAANHTLISIAAALLAIKANLFERILT
jgi:hypothetical protein